VPEKIHRMLVTAPAQTKMCMWAATASFATWIQGWPTAGGETWLVTVPGRDVWSFCHAAAQLGVTVAEIMD
jgi:hypothetical protein